MEIKIKEITKNELEIIKNNLKKNEEDNDLYFNSDSLAIIYNEITVGLITFNKWYPNNLSISICIDKDYRGKGIAGIAIEKAVQYYGKNNTDIYRFLYNVYPNNKSSIRVIEKLNWEKTEEYDETILNEGIDYFKVFYKNNPYYKKGKVKVYDNK